MCDETGLHSGSHGIPSWLIQEQARNINIPLIQVPTSRNHYETHFKTILSQLKIQGIDAGIFGDIYLEPHREWIERVCSEMDIKPLFPLWGADTTQLLKDFIGSGFKAVTVAIRNDKLTENWLGRLLDDAFYEDITKMPNIDACAEQGEYHTFVYDGPLFSNPVKFLTGETTFNDNHLFLKLLQP